MANATSKGVGSGTAVLDDYSVLNKATGNFFKNYREDAEKAEAKRVEDEKKKKAAKDQLTGMLEYDPDKLRIPDKQPLFESYQEIRKKYEGKYADMENNPLLMNEYQDDIARFKIRATNSIDSKKKLSDLYVAAQEPDSGYSPEKIKKIEKYALLPNATYQEAKEFELLTPDVVTGNYFGRIDDSIGNSGKALYDTEKYSREDENGKTVVVDKQTWKPDAKETFEAALTPRDLSDMNIKYKHLPEEERKQALFDDYKTVKDTSYDNLGWKRDSEGDGGSGGFISDKFRSAYFKTSGAEGFTISKVSGSRLSPISVSSIDEDTGQEVKTFVPTEFVRTGMGNFVRGVASTDSWESLSKEEKDEWKKNNPKKGEAEYKTHAARGVTVTIPLTETVESKLKSAYGIEGFNEHIDYLKGTPQPARNNSKKTESGSSNAYGI